MCLMLDLLDLRRRHCAEPTPRGTWYATCRFCRRVKKPYSCACAAGYTYNGVGALSLLGKLPRHKTDLESEGRKSTDFVENVIKWLVSRQTLMLHEEDELPMADEEPPDMTPKFFPPMFHVQGAFPVSVADTILPNPSIEMSPHDLQWAGFNGRCNKVADTCYAFWVGGTLGVSLSSAVSACTS